jgi:crotonobetainyl-CoA:carnitine CoA-transferase CaiB-like acyl-CoA transferase
MHDGDRGEPQSRPDGPLAGVRVLELGNFVAAPMAARILADFGAEVVKVEPPDRGDELRAWGTRIPTTDGATISAWWLSMARNKRLVTLDLRQPAGRDLALRLAARCDIVIENFRPGRLEAWDLGPERLHAANPRLVLIRISGFGQTGPYRERAGYGNVGEAMGGLRYVTGYADRPPVRVQISLGDALAAQQAVMGGLMALRHAERTGRGQVVDVAIAESVFAMTEAMLTEYLHAGVVRERSGNIIERAAPSNVYRTADGHWMAISANGENVFPRLATAMGRPDLAADERFRNNPARVAHVDELDALIGAWVGARARDEVQRILDAAGVPAGPVYSVADIAADPQFQAREMITRVPDERVPDGTVAMPGIVPALSATPGTIIHSGRQLGADNAAVYGDLLGIGAEEIAALRARGVI